MVIEDRYIDGITEEEKQLLYDAIINRIFELHKMSKTNHVAADIFHEDEIKLSSIAVIMRAQWPNLIH